MLKTYKIAGVDEVGRGCLAGPVFAAAVILNKNINTKKIRDSKKVNFKERILLSKYIKKNSIYAVGSASVKEIEKINILNASLLSMKRALSKLKFIQLDLTQYLEHLLLLFHLTTQSQKSLSSIKIFFLLN